LPAGDAHVEYARDIRCNGVFHAVLVHDGDSCTRLNDERGAEAVVLDGDLTTRSPQFSDIWSALDTTELSGGSHGSKRGELSAAAEALIEKYPEAWLAEFDKLSQRTKRTAIGAALLRGSGSAQVRQPVAAC
jgi:hypothetical protein